MVTSDHEGPGPRGAFVALGWIIDNGGQSIPIPNETAMAKAKKTYRVEIEAKLDVEAFDEVSAKKKVEKLLGSRRGIGADVVATGDVWTYAAPLVRDPRKAGASPTK